MTFGEFKKENKYNKGNLIICVNGEERDEVQIGEFDDLEVIGSGHHPDGRVLVDLVDPEYDAEDVSYDKEEDDVDNEYEEIVNGFFNKYKLLKVINIAIFIVLLIVVFTSIFIGSKHKETVNGLNQEINRLTDYSTELNHEINRLTAYSSELEIEINLLKNNDIIKPCFACGSHNVDMYSFLNEYFIECNECEISTGHYSSKSDLIEYWNSIGK